MHQIDIRNRTLSNVLQFEEVVKQNDTFLFDCDGVIWNGDKVVDGAIEALSYLRKQNKAIIFVTNNASKSRQNYKKKFDDLGIQASVDEIFGSAYAAATYISTILALPKSKKVYVIGMSGLETELENEGISYVGGTAPEDNTLSATSIPSFTPDPDVAVVLTGLDTSINYVKLSKAFQYLRLEGPENEDPPVLFLATNMDTTYPAEGGVILPGAGALCASLRVATGREPIVLGKPSQRMLDAIKAKHNFDPSRTIMIGDRLDTDIAFGNNGGLRTLLVLTGVTTERILTKSDIEPTYIAKSLGDFRLIFNPPR